MTWLKLPDDWSNRPDILALSAEAFRLHVGGMSHAMKHLTDRVIARHVVGMLAPGYRPRLVDELVTAGLWRSFPDESGWWIADPAMDEQPTRAEVIAEREATAARQDLSRAKKVTDPAAKRTAEAKATQRADEARRAIAAAKESKRLHLGMAPWEGPAAVAPVPQPAPAPDPVEVPVLVAPVTGAVTCDVTCDERCESHRPVPTRPGEPTVLSGTEAGDLMAASVPAVPLAALGVPPPPGPRPRTGRFARPADEEAIDDCRRILTDPRSPSWLVAQAEDQLMGLGLTREALLTTSGSAS